MLLIFLIISYLPVNIKDAIAIVITDRTMFEQKKYTDENGEIKFRKTDNIHVNSFVQYDWHLIVAMSQYGIIARFIKKTFQLL